MKKLLLLCLLGISTLAYAGGDEAYLKNAPKGRCSGGANCTACSNCRYCGHCAGGGDCSVCNPDKYTYHAPRKIRKSKRHR